MQNKFAYIELLFKEEALEFFKEIVQNTVNDSEFYYSDVIPRIHGDVSSKAHLTLFYGLDESTLNNPKLKEFVEKVDIKEIKLGSLFLIKGYQDLYKVLCVEVLDENKQLKNLVKQILEFKHDESLGKREFIPHVTLAYVKPEYELPDYSSNEKSIKVKNARLSI